MFAGVAGLNSHGKALSSVADNISNINTTGFKSSRANFGDVMVQALSMGGTLSNQVGTGSRVLNIQNLMTQGSFESTDQATDLAINGSGFFLVTSPDATGTGTSDVYYTRAGEFLMDKEGYVVNTQGMRLMGFNVDSNGNLEQTATALRLVTQQTDAVPSSQVDMSVNLDASDDDKHHPSEAIDPNDSDTYNYMNTVTVYDSLGIGHDMALVYQRISTYDGTEPTNTASSWKVGVYEIDDGTLTANPAFPDNTFYMHFDTDGQLLGTSTGQPAYGDMYTSSGTVSAVTSNVSDRMGESFTYTSEGVTQSIYTTGTVTFTVATAGTETVTVGTDTYTLGVNATSALAAQDLADQINSSATAEYYATVAGSVVTLYSRQSSTTTFDLATSETTITLDDETTMNDIVSLIDNSRAATGMVNIGSAVIGDEVEINGTTYTMAAVYVAGTDVFTNAAELAAEVNTDSGAVLTATSFGTDNVTITYDTAGTAGNAVTLNSDPNSTNTGSIYASASTLLNGLDDTTSTNVNASAVASGSGYALRLARTDTGAAATITMGTGNTLGDNLSLDFDNFTQDQYASAAQSTSSVETSGEHTISYDFTDATPNQEITFDFTPTSSSSSTQSAGDYDTFYLHQDGSPRGTLESLDIDSDGLITGQFSNGTLATLGAVALSNVANPNALKREGENLWSWTREAGDPLPATQAGSSGLGSIESGALEQSNVDLATEFVKMINYQRAYQANTKTISTTDSMLAELINLKR